MGTAPCVTVPVQFDAWTVGARHRAMPNTPNRRRGRGMGEKIDRRTGAHPRRVGSSLPRHFSHRKGENVEPD